jgi:MFS transporter, ACS family, glucarate transporter
MTTDDEPQPTGIRWRIFALACGTSFLLYLHRYSWNMVRPNLIDEYGLSNTRAEFFFSVFYLTYACGQIPSGVIVDKFGARKFLTISIAAWSLSLAALGASSSLVVLALWRLIFGAAQAGCYPALTKVTRNWFPVARRTLVQGIVASGLGRSGAALSSIVLGTLLMGRLGLSWRVSLGIMGGVGIAFSLLFWIFFRDMPDDHADVNDAERTLIGKGLIATQAHASEPFSARRAVRSRSLQFLVGQQFLDAGSDVAFVSLLGSYFLQTYGFDLAKIGWLASLPLWGGALGGTAGGWLNDRLIASTGNRRWSRSGVGFVGKVLGCAMLLLATRQSNGVAAAWCLFAAKLFSDTSQPTVWGACADIGGRFTATVFSIGNTAGTIGGVVMPLVFGALLDWFTTATSSAGIAAKLTDWSPLFLLLAAMYLASGVCWLFIDCTRSLEHGESGGR